MASSGIVIAVDVLKERCFSLASCVPQSRYDLFGLVSFANHSLILLKWDTIIPIGGPLHGALQATVRGTIYIQDGGNFVYAVATVLYREDMNFEAGVKGIFESAKFKITNGDSALAFSKGRAGRGYRAPNASTELSQHIPATSQRENGFTWSWHFTSRIVAWTRLPSTSSSRSK